MTATVKLPNPQFKVNDDPDFYLFEVEVWHRVHPGANPFAVMLSSFGNHPEAKAWAQNLFETEANVMDKSCEDLAALFLKRFAPKVQSKKLEAMQSLLDGKVKMDTQKGVTEYASRFAAIVQRAALLDVSLTLMLFRRGLTQNLLAPCRVNYLGEEFATLEALVLHAVGEEKRIKETSHGRVAVHYMHSDQTPRPKRRFSSSQDKSDKRKSGGGAHAHGKKQKTGGGAGPSNDATPAAAQGNDSAVTTLYSHALKRNLSKIEWANYKAEGKCFKCSAKGHLGRHCTKHPGDGPSVNAMEIDPKPNA